MIKYYSLNRHSVGGDSSTFVGHRTPLFYADMPNILTKKNHNASYYNATCLEVSQRMYGIFRNKQLDIGDFMI